MSSEVTDSPRWAESGFEIKREYTPDDVSADFEARLGGAGRYPYTRHIHPTGYRQRSWQPSLYSGFGDPADANRRFRYLLEQGNGRANIAFDLPTQIGLDSDHPSAVHEVGRLGVAVDSLADFEVLLDGIPLDRTPVSLNVNAMAPAMLAMLVVTTRRQKAALSSIRGTLANDILHEYLGRGTWRYPVVPSMRVLVDTAEFCVRHLPMFYPFNLRGVLLHESGANPPQEAGTSLSIARCYIDELLSRGLAVDDFAGRISFFFGTGLHFFEEAAKFRATRRVWAQILRDEYGSQSRQSQALRFTTVATCGSHFTKQMPQLNLVRGTLGCLAGALGGAQTMLGTTIDEAYDIPSEANQLLALRTQQIVALESDVTATVDPLGGSYFVEAMTDEIESMIRDTMARIDRDYGGIVAAVESGTLQREIERRAYEVQRDIDSGRRPRVGVNTYACESAEGDLDLWQPDTDLLERRLQGLARLRQERSEPAVRRALSHLARVCESSENIMGAMIEAVETYATVGEIATTLEGVFGVHREPAFQ